MQTSYQMFIETEVPENELIVSRTDVNGRITYANETFAHISGYRVDELIGKPHNIVRHPDMPRSVFKEMWESLKREEIWRGNVKTDEKMVGIIGWTVWSNKTMIPMDTSSVIPLFAMMSRLK